MNHVHRKVVGFGIFSAALVAGAYALLGIGLAVIVAVGLFVVGAVILAGVVVFEEEVRLPWWEDAQNPEHDHGYHPAR